MIKWVWPNNTEKDEVQFRYKIWCNVKKKMQHFWAHSNKIKVQHFGLTHYKINTKLGSVHFV